MASSTPSADKVYRIANAEVGYHEGSNNYNKYAAYVGVPNNAAWCCTFASWIMKTAGFQSLAPMVDYSVTAYNWYHSRGRSSVYPALGAEVYYGPGGEDHVGWCYAYDADHIYTIEGNWDNQVSKMKRPRREPLNGMDIFAYGLPAYPEGIVTADPAHPVAGSRYQATGSLTLNDPPPTPVPVPVEPKWISFRQVLWAAQNSIAVERAAPAGDDNPQDDVAAVQDALKVTVGLDADYNRGFFDGATGDAYQKWQVSLYGAGPDADSIPGPDSLVKLGAKTNLFQVRDFGTPPPGTPGKISTGQVDFSGKGTWKSGRDACIAYITQACQAIGVPTTYWVPGMATIAERESAYNSPAWQINTTDSNARNVPGLFGGGNAPDGYKAMCSRGMIQAIPQTFASYHQSGTTVKIYDPVASAAAGINYIISVYKVNRDGSNLTAKVQQADPSRTPKGY